MFKGIFVTPAAVERLLFAFWALALAAGSGRCAETAAPPPFVPEFRLATISPALAEAAATASVPTAGFELAAARDELRKDDSVTALVTHVASGKSRQWLVQLVGNDLSERERQMPSPPALRMFSSTGNELAFNGDRGAVAIRVFGPYAVASEGRAARNPGRGAEDLWSGTLVNAGFLGLGFDRMCAMSTRISDVMRRAPEPRTSSFHIGAASAPYPAEEVARNRELAQKAGVTLEDEHAMLGAFPAIEEFFRIVIRTPGLRDILRTVLDVPWLSIISRGGKIPAVSIGFVPIHGTARPEDWGLPVTTPVYFLTFRLHLNEKPALACRLAVIAPQPPFRASAGIVGIAAQRPDGKGPHLMIQLIASRCAPEAGSEIVTPST